MEIFNNDGRFHAIRDTRCLTRIVAAACLTPLFALLAVWGWYANVGEVKSWNDDQAQNSGDHLATILAGETNVVAALPSNPTPSKSSVTFISISLSYEHACGVLTSGKIVCWGGNYFGQATPPDGEFKSVSAGRYYSCGVRTDDTVTCWGQGIGGTPEDTAFQSVSVHHDTACGIMVGGSIMCWSNGIAYQVREARTYQQVGVGNGHVVNFHGDKAGIFKGISPHWERD